MTAPEWSWWQQATNGVGWSAPAADVLDLPRDHTPVDTSRPMTWPEQLRHVTVRVGPSTMPWAGSLAGIPMQAVRDDAPMRPIVTGNPDWHPRLTTRALPIPAPPWAWIEGHPRRPLVPWQEPAGAWDRHWIGVGSRLVWEVIGLDNVRGRALGCTVWTRSGEWVDGDGRPGTGVCAADVPMYRHVVTRRSLTAPHVAALVLPDYFGADGTLGTDGFPRCGQKVRLGRVPAGLTGAARDLALLLHTHGAVIADRTRGGYDASVWVQPGWQWVGTALDTLRLPLSAFELVV